MFLPREQQIYQNSKQSCAAGAECPKIASRRCCARRPELPGLEPWGKPRSARTASWLCVVKLLGISLSKKERLLEGWRFNSSAQVKSSEKSAVPRDSSARMTLPYRPSRAHRKARTALEAARESTPAGVQYKIEGP